MNISQDLHALNEAYKSLEDFNMDRVVYDAKAKKYMTSTSDNLLSQAKREVLNFGLGKWRIHRDDGLTPIMVETHKVMQKVLTNLNSLNVFTAQEIRSELDVLWNEIDKLREQKTLTNAFEAAPGRFTKDTNAFPQFVSTFFETVSEDVLEALVSVKKHISKLEFEISQALPYSTKQIYKHCLGESLKAEENLIQQFIRDNEGFPNILLKDSDASEENIVLDLNKFKIGKEQIPFISPSDAYTKVVKLPRIQKKTILKNLLPYKIQSLLNNDYELIRKAIVLMTQGAEFDTYMYLNSQALNENHILTPSPSLDFNNRVIFEIQKKSEVLLKINRTYCFTDSITNDQIRKIRTTTIFNLSNLQEKPSLIIN
jgi:hypothetical protein